MNVAPDGRVLAVCDTSVLLNFALIDRLPLLTDSRWRVNVPNHVVREVRSGECEARVITALRAGRLTELEITEMAEIERYANYRRRFGDGESAALAVGVNRRWTVAIDEKGPSRREVLETLGEELLLTTPIILRVAIADGLIAPAAIPQIRNQLAANRYSLEFVPGETKSSTTEFPA